MTALFYHKETHECVAITCCCVIPGDKRIDIPHLVIIDGNYDEKTTLDAKEYQLISMTDSD